MIYSIECRSSESEYDSIDWGCMGGMRRGDEWQGSDSYWQEVAELTRDSGFCIPYDEDCDGHLVFEEDSSYAWYGDYCEGATPWNYENIDNYCLVFREGDYSDNDQIFDSPYVKDLMSYDCWFSKFFISTAGCFDEGVVKLNIEDYDVCLAIWAAVVVTNMHKYTGIYKKLSPELPVMFRLLFSSFYSNTLHLETKQGSGDAYLISNEISAVQFKNACLGKREDVPLQANWLKAGAYPMCLTSQWGKGEDGHESFFDFCNRVLDEDTVHYRGFFTDVTIRKQPVEELANLIYEELKNA